MRQPSHETILALYLRHCADTLYPIQPAKVNPMYIPNRERNRSEGKDAPSKKV